MITAGKQIDKTNLSFTSLPTIFLHRRTKTNKNTHARSRIKTEVNFARPMTIHQTRAGEKREVGEGREGNVQCELHK